MKVGERPPEPLRYLYLDVLGALQESAESSRFERSPEVFGGRYGLSSKEFTPAMVKAVLEHLLVPRPKRHFARDAAGTALRTR
jgi:pyruvate/2-oxoacid:ferredoxin oxidoreductase alpha subunit